MQRELLPLDPANAQLPSLLGLGLLQELVTLLDGELRLEPYELQGQSLVCILPLRRRSHLQTTLQGYFSQHPVSLRLSDDSRRQQLQQWLQNWQIPCTTEPPESHQILLTDLHRQEHNSDLTLTLHNLEDWSEISLMLALETLTRQQPGAAGKPPEAPDRPAPPATRQRPDLNAAQPGRRVRNQADAGTGNTDAAATRSGQPVFENTGCGRQQHRPSAVRALSAESECAA